MTNLSKYALGAGLGLLCASPALANVTAPAVAPQVVETIQQVASTDSIGDGKIFVLDLASVTRIRTGETGDTAL